ncbi:MAG TPA: ABC transporter permease [Bacteroidia bacterium]|nr:ABC transporter permease [Bacteroidia bacterium]HRH08705.1 ABC transporter permease [Bacteroidia bacterium]
MNVTHDSDEKWTLVVKPEVNPFDLRLAELWRYRDLVMLFVRRDFVSTYKQTILGPLWFIIQPVLTTLTFTIIFGNIAKIPTDGIPQMLFYLSGLVSWNYFAECLNKTSNTFIGNAHIFGKVYFPRMAVPVSIVISNLVTYFIQFLLFLGFYVYFIATGTVVHPNAALLLLPFLLLIMACLGLGMGIIISSMTTKYRDLRFLVTFGVQLMMYATPVIYPMSLLSPKAQFYISLNPMSSVIETFRYAFLGSGNLNFMHLTYSAIFSLSILFIGVLFFNKVEKNFMDTV